MRLIRMEHIGLIAMLVAGVMVSTLILAGVARSGPQIVKVGSQSATGNVLEERPEGALSVLGGGEVVLPLAQKGAEVEHVEGIPAPVGTTGRELFTFAFTATELVQVGVPITVQLTAVGTDDHPLSDTSRFDTITGDLGIMLPPEFTVLSTSPPSAEVTMTPGGSRRIVWPKMVISKDEIQGSDLVSAQVMPITATTRTKGGSIIYDHSIFQFYTTPIYIYVGDGEEGGEIDANGFMTIVYSEDVQSRWGPASASE